MSDEPIDVVATVGPLDVTVATLREFIHRSGALRVVAIVDLAPGEGPAVVDCARLAPTEVTAGGRMVHLPHAIELDAEVPPLPEVRQLPPFQIDQAQGEIAGIVGGVEHLGGAVVGLAELLGARNVAMAQFETDDPEVPLTITARAGGTDPVVVAIGEDDYEMDLCWPDPAPVAE